MDLYTIWADKEGDISDLDWVNGMKSFFDHLISEGKMESYRITRCKMGFRSIADMPEWKLSGFFNIIFNQDYKMCWGMGYEREAVQLSL